MSGTVGGYKSMLGIFGTFNSTSGIFGASKSTYGISGTFLPRQILMSRYKEMNIKG